MLYVIAHYLRDKLPFIWSIIDIANSSLFGLRYGNKLKVIEQDVLIRYENEYGLKIVPMRDVMPENLSAFFAAQPEQAFVFFNPHGFDTKTIKKLMRNRSFIAYCLIDGNTIAAYCFIRSFFIGKGFRGRMVGIDYRGRGLSTLMNKFLNEIGFAIGLHLFETVSKNNVPSYRSALSASNVRIVKEMENDELYLEILKDNN